MKSRVGRSTGLRAGLVLALLGSAGAGGSATEAQGQEDPGLLGKPYAEDGLSPAEAVARMTVPEGFSVDLIAAEPDVRQPVAMAIDARGRIWVAEAFSYPERRPDGEGHDRLVIFEDADADGSFETRKVFVDNLNLVSGFEIGFGGVWVGAAPHLLFIPDRDGDDRPDGEPEVLLDGWGFHDTHETLNSFLWGPDGWLYGCHGVFTHSKVGKPGTPDDERVPINAGFWRFHPVRHAFEVFAWGTSNPWGLDYDDRGQFFAEACVIPHFWHVIQGARYQRQAGQHFNPHVYDDIKTIADHLHYIGDTPHAGNQQSDAAGGGHAHCGFAFYLGDQFPPRYRGRPMIFNVHGHRINQEQLVRRGSGWVALHLPDLMLSNDRWFMGVALRVGPQGSLYFIDWYDRQNCHRREPEIWDRSNGRLYRLRYGSPDWKPVDVVARTDAELVDLQRHPNDWWVRTARRVLHERAASGTLDQVAVHAGLRAMLLGDADPAHRLRALWALHVTGGIDEAGLHALLSDEDEYVRGWAVQLAGDDRFVGSALRDRVVGVARTGGSQHVRLQAASLLQRLPSAARWPLAEGLVSHEEDAGDHNLPLMVWYGIEPLVAEDPDRALELAAVSKLPTVSRFIVRRAAADPAGLEAAVAALGRSGNDPGRARLILAEITEAVRKRPDLESPPGWGAAYAALRDDADAGLRRGLQELAIRFGDRSTFPDLRASLADAGTPAEDRRRILAILSEAGDVTSLPAIRAALDEPALRIAAVRALARFEDPGIAAFVLERFEAFSAPEKAEAVAALTTRAGWSRALLEAVAAGSVDRKDVSAFAARQIRQFDDEGLNALLERAWGRVTTGSPETVRAEIERFRKVFTAEALRAANLQNGRAVYDRTCGICHQLFGTGGRIGPDITGSNRANLDYILENVLDPNAVVGRDYLLNLVTRRDGQVVAGMVVGQNDASLTLRQVNGEDVIVALSDIAKRDVSPVSMMPPGQLQALSADDARDLIAYLASPAQVPHPGEGPYLDPAAGKVSGALEGESLETAIVTAGTAAPQAMGGFPADRWSGNSHLWWTGGKVGDELTVLFPVAEEGRYEVFAVMTKAPDYAVVDLSIDGVPAATGVDLFEPGRVVTTGPLSLGEHFLPAGEHRFETTIRGRHPDAVPAFMTGLDFLWLRKVE